MGQKRLQVRNPFTGKIDRSYWPQKFEEMREIVAQLRKTQSEWKKVPLEERVAKVQKALNYFEENKSQIAEDVSRQMGRPVAQAAGEIGGLLERGHYLCEIAESVLKPDNLPKEGFDRKITHAPYGVIYIMSAWNFPLLITINSVVPALIAGNTVLLKHSSQTPEIGEHFVRAFAGIFQEDQKLIQHIIVNHEASGKIISEGLVDHVIFTGSVSGGKKILQHCAESLIAPNLELGGKDGAYVDASCDLKQAVETVVDGCCFNAGQSCCGIERVYVHEDIHDEFVQKAETLLREYRLGDPENPETNMGPIAVPSGISEMEEQVKQAVAGGAKLLFGGKKVVQGEAEFFEPTLLTDVTNDMRVMKEENFGPILPVMKVSGMEEAAKLVNDCEFGLTSAIFTKEKEQAEAYFDLVDAGTIFMNRCDYLDPALPWTGFKKSGCGSSLSKYGFYSVTQRKAKHFRL